MKLRKKVIRTVDLGFGTCSSIINDQHDILTIKSIVHPVEEHKKDITSGAMNNGKNITVKVDNTSYLVGQDIEKVSDPRNNRVLNSNYINSAQYQALFLGCLAMMELGEDNVIDFLIGGLPVSNMHRKNELIDFMEGEHEVDGRTITVKKAWAAAQPLGGLMSYANTQGQDFLNSMTNITILTVDFGYFTVDHLVTTGMFVSESRSGAVDKGMSQVIGSVSDQAASIFNVDKILNEVIDKAFYHGEKPSLKFRGQRYPFPVCNGKNINGEDVRYKFDFTDAINRVTREACEAIHNNVGDAQDVDLILVVGGPSHVYFDSLKSVYPDHRIIVVENHLQANAIGLHVTGLMKFRAMEKKKAMEEQKVLDKKKAS